MGKFQHKSKNAKKRKALKTLGFQGFLLFSRKLLDTNSDAKILKCSKFASLRRWRFWMCFDPDSSFFVSIWVKNWSILEHLITLKVLKTVFRACFFVKKSISYAFLKNVEPTSTRLNPGGSKYSKNSACPGMFFDVIGTYVNIRHQLFSHWRDQVFWRW